MGAGADVAVTAAVVVLPVLLELTRDNTDGVLGSVTVVVALSDWDSDRWLGR